jgi:hypothetical protein
LTLIPGRLRLPPKDRQLQPLRPDPGGRGHGRGGAGHRRAVHHLQAGRGRGDGGAGQGRGQGRPRQVQGGRRGSGGGCSSQAYVDKEDPNKGKLLRDVWKKVRRVTLTLSRGTFASGPGTTWSWTSTDGSTSRTGRSAASS